MADFTPIQTQEEFDALIQDRLERARNTVRKEFADYDSIKNKLTEFESKNGKLSDELAELKKQNEELTQKLSASETDSAKTRIALKHGLPFEFAPRLRGSTESEIEEDAKGLEEMLNAGAPAAPLYQAEGNRSRETEAWGELADALSPKA